MNQRNKLVFLAAVGASNLLLLACSNDAAPELPPNDETEDTGDPPGAGPAARTDVSVEVSLRDGTGRPDPGAFAIFVAADGTVVQHGVVDAQGRASARLEAGGVVHLVQPALVGVYITTIRDVAPGDVLRGGGGTASWSGRRHRMTATYPAEPTGADLVTSCGTDLGADNAGEAPLRLYEDCSDERFDVVALLKSAGEPQRYLVARDQQRLDGGTVALAGPWRDLSTVPLEVRNVPAGIDGLHLGRRAVLRSARAAVAFGATSRISRPAAGTVQGTLSYVPDVGEETIISASWALQRVPQTPMDGYHELSVFTSTSATTPALDLTAGSVSSLRATTQRAPNMTTFQWERVGAPAGDYRILTWQGAVVRPGGSDINVFWTVIDPATADANDTDALTTLALPSLPADYAAYDLTQQPESSLRPLLINVSYVDLLGVNGYDEARSIPLNALDPELEVELSQLVQDQPIIRRLSRLML